jgi:phosphomannomutase
MDILAEYTHRIVERLQARPADEDRRRLGQRHSRARRARHPACARLRGVELYSEVDGDFPNHHPDPSKPENLADLIRTVAATGAEIGLAFDGDGDRSASSPRTATSSIPDRQLMLFATDMPARNRARTIIYDVKCTQRLAPAIRRPAASR